ncbi:MAG: serine hydrolase [Deltaproteobacteria bacterium]|nr:serine hydrolase [Deltaproteobacteria bacterium]
MAPNCILLIFLAIFIIPLTAFGFEPQANSNYVDNLVSRVTKGQGAPQVSPTVVHANAPNPNRAAPRHRPLLIKNAPAFTPLTPTPVVGNTQAQPRVKAKAMFCVDKSSNKVMLAENESAPLPIASITKLLTAMIVIDHMDLNAVVETPSNIREVEKHTVGIRPGDLFTVKDLLHGMLIESGNDCAEALARAYPKGGRTAFIEAMNSKAQQLGLSHVKIYTPSGLDYKFILGKKDGRELQGKKPNIATAEDVAALAGHAFKYPLIAQISSTKTYMMKSLNPKPREYSLVSNDKLLRTDLPVAGAKTGFTNMAGKCIVALFKDNNKEHLVVVLNTPHHFKAAEKIYRWATKTF